MLDERSELTLRSPWLSALPTPTAQMILSNAVSKKYLRENTIYELGDPPGGIFGVTEGIIAIQTDDTEPSIVIGHLFGQGYWFGESAALCGVPRQVGAVVKSEEASVLSVSLPTIERLAKQYPEVWRALAGLCAMNSNIAVQTARDLMIRNPKARCLAVLKRLSSSLLPGQAIPLSQDELATMCALSRGSVSRILQGLERDGMVEISYRSLRLHEDI
ncbi:MAG: Crp/Fnr family transcriptional regulator [Dinoroseobacter sp.]|nr:Crp/Fnr family transcriptional regulator [Dinoroseobacter sp.]